MSRPRYGQVSAPDGGQLAPAHTLNLSFVATLQNSYGAPNPVGPGLTRYAYEVAPYV